MPPIPAAATMRGIQALAATAMNAPTNLPPTTLPAAAYRSEAFAEDLFELSGFRSGAREPGESAKASRGSVVSTALLAGVPLLVALLGGALAYWQAGG